MYYKLFNDVFEDNKNKICIFEIGAFYAVINKQAVYLSELLEGTYTFSNYHLFYVLETKKRKILAATFRDRIVHTWYVNSFILPYFVPAFIYSSYACIKGKGMHMAAKDVMKGIKTCSKLYCNPYVIKMDIKKYFENINREKVYELVSRKIKDKHVLKLTRKILDSSSAFDNVSGVSLPIGNYTSQMFANIYLNELDRFIKDKLHVKWYFRYMDDAVLIVESF